MRVEVLGDGRVCAAGGTLTGAALGGRRARIVLTYLALATGPVTAAELAEAIWGDAPPATWPVALRGTVRGLRRALAGVGAGEQAVIATTPTGYALAAGVDVDVQLAQATVRRAAGELAAGRHRAAADAAAGVAELAGAHLLPGEDGAWLAPHRAAIAAAAVDGLELLAEARSRLGEHPDAIAAARRAVALAPLDERSHRALIGALHRSGDRAGAVRAYETCRATLAEELGVDPSAETVAAYLQATAGHGPTPSARAPVTDTSFVGRRDLAATLRAAVSAPGLVTLVGRGGVGKTRLAAVVVPRAAEFAARYWIALGALDEDTFVAPTIALGLDLAGAGGDETGALVDFLAAQGRVLLVLDGADRVIDGVATVAVALAEACPLLTVLVTCRTALDLAGETVVTVAPFPVPEPTDMQVLQENPQIRLLSDRVRSAGGTLVLDEAETVAAAVELCRRCDGLPLALELAAAQLADMSLGDLVDQLGDAAYGQVRAIAASSYALLDAEEASVFTRFAVLDGPVGLGFARAVVGGDGVVPARVVRILHALAARALLTIDTAGPRWRYSQDDDLHAWAGELLAADGGAAAAYGRLLDAIDALVPQDATTPPQGYAAELTAVLGSVRSALRAAVSGRADPDRALGLAFRLHRYWAATSLAEGRFWLRRLLAAAPESSWRRYAMFGLGYLGYWAGDVEAALAELVTAVELFGDEPSPFVARALIYVAGLHDDTDRPAEAMATIRRSIAAAEPFDVGVRVGAAMGVASLTAERGDPRAAAHAADAVALSRTAGTPEQLAAVLPTAATICWQVGALEQARAHVAEAMPLHAGVKRIARVVLLSGAAALALADGDVRTAVEHGRTADAEAAELGVGREAPLIRSVLARALLRSGDLEAAAAGALAAVESAVAIEVTYPAALALESAALVARARGAAPADVAALVGTAAAIRERGDRPPPAPLAADLHGMPPGPPVPLPEAVALARRVLGASPARAEDGGS